MRKILVLVEHSGGVVDDSAYELAAAARSLGEAGGDVSVVGAVLGNIVVAFSWWGVNLLNVGLHTYGFTGGIARSLNYFYLLQVAVAAVGIYLGVRSRMNREVPAPE